MARQHLSRESQINSVDKNGGKRDEFERVSGMF
jgi:hypothetical protein